MGQRDRSEANTLQPGSVLTLDSGLNDSRVVGVRNEGDDEVVLGNGFL